MATHTATVTDYFTPVSYLDGVHQLTAKLLVGMVHEYSWIIIKTAFFAKANGNDVHFNQ